MKSSLFYKIFLSIILITLLFFSFFTSAKQASSERLKKLTMEIRCMTCQNQSIHDSDSDYSKDIKILVKEKFKEGLTEKEIKDFLTKRYGEYILFKPYFSSKNLLLWLFHFILMIVCMLVLIKNTKKTNTK